MTEQIEALERLLRRLQQLAARVPEQIRTMLKEVWDFLIESGVVNAAMTRQLKGAGLPKTLILQPLAGGRFSTLRGPGLGAIRGPEMRPQMYRPQRR